MRHLPLALAVMSLSLSASLAQAEIRWETNLRTAHAKATDEGKLLLLHFYSDNCVWCDRLEQGAFQSPQVIETINQNFVPVKIHAGRNPTVASSFRVKSFPTDVIVTTEGTPLTHSVSPQAADQYVAMLTPHMQEKNVAAVAKADAPRAAKPSETASASKPASAEPAAPVAAPVADAATTKKDIPARAVSHRSEPITAAEPSKSVSYKLALDGYCPVALLEKNDWFEGNPEFGVIHLGHLYLFTDEAAMKTFLADPEPYTPVLNGIDVVLFFEEKRIEPGKRDFGSRDPDHNRMFFFASEEALIHFENQYNRYTDAAINVTRRAIADANPQR